MNTRLKKIVQLSMLGALADPICAIAAEQVSHAVLEEVTVTARKREESLQDVPVVATAFDAAAIERRGIASMEDIAAGVPGLSLQAPGNPTQNVINLRGIESGNIGVGFDQPVSINVDGVQFSNAEFLKAGQFDLASIEVLKGPQALFFGKNSPAGVISIQTANPTDHLFTQLRAGYETGTDKTVVEGIVSGPLTDTVGGRLAVSYTDSEGWWENTHPSANAKKLPDYEETIMRGTLRMEPTDAFTATLKYTYQKHDGKDGLFQDLVGCSGSNYSPYDDCKLNGKGASADPSAPSAFGTFDPSLSPLWKDEPYTDNNLYIGSLDLSYDLNDQFTVSSVTGWSRLDNTRFDNIITGGDPLLLVVGENQQQKTLSEEIRITGDFDTMRVMFGVFMDDREIQQDSDLVLVGSPLPFARQVIDGETLSVFGQAEFDLSTEFKLSVGGRYTDEQKEYSGQIRQANGVVRNGIALQDGDALAILDPEIHEYDFSPEVSLSYFPTNDVMLYVAYKEGFKSGSFGMSQTAVRNFSERTLPNYPLSSRANSFLSEEVDGFEIGMKSEWFDNRLRLNVVAFDYDYKNLQLSGWDPATVSARTFNAGAATTRGLEIESLYVPESVDGLTISANLALLDAKYTEWFSDCSRDQIEVTGAAGGCNVDLRAGDAGGLLTGTGFDAQDRSGDALRAAPETVFQLGAIYERDLTSGLLFNANATATWTEKHNVDILANASGENPDRWILNAGVGIATADDRWAVDLIARNLTDETYMYFSEYAGLSFISGERAYTANTNPPRSVMLRVTWRPNGF